MAGRVPATPAAARPKSCRVPRAVHTLGRDLRADRHDLCTDLS